MTGHESESELRERFARLRAEDQRTVPRFSWQPRLREPRVRWRMVSATATLLFVLIVSGIGLHRRAAATFSEADRSAVHALAAWHAPTDVLLRTPENQLLTTTPRIPDLKGILR